MASHSRIYVPKCHGYAFGTWMGGSIMVLTGLPGTDETGPMNYLADPKSNFCAAALEMIRRPDKMDGGATT